MNGLAASPAPVDVHDLALFDLDGVVYVGPHAVPGAPEAIAKLRAAGVRTAFVTNNASRPPETISAHLTDLGVPTAPAEVVTSAQVAAALLALRLPPRSRVLVVGGEGLLRALGEEGLTPVGSFDEEPVAVVQGFGPDVGWRLLAEGSRAVRAGLPWLATNTDLTVPTQYGPAPGNGALVAAVSAATGARPEVAGKPQPPLFLEAARRLGGTAPLVIGDRLDTDLEGARAAGMPGLLVLTGVSTPTELLSAPPERRPTLLAKNLSGLFTEHPGSTPDGNGGWRCNAAVVRADPDRLVVASAGDDPMDLLRAACAASWQVLDDRPAPAPVPVAVERPDPAEVLAALARIEG